MEGIRWVASLIIVAGLLLASRTSDAAPRWLVLNDHRVEVYRGPVTLRQYWTIRPTVVYATPTTFSNRRGAPVGLFVIAGHVHKGRTRTRCVIQIDRTGHKVTIGYEVWRPIYHAFEAGPCLMGWERGAHQAVRVALQRERISKSFADAVTERSVLCLDKSGRLLAPFRLRASLWTVAEIVMKNGADRCINLDGGSQLAPDAVNPAVLGLLPTKTADLKKERQPMTDANENDRRVEPEYSSYVTDVALQNLGTLLGLSAEEIRSTLQSTAVEIVGRLFPPQPVDPTDRVGGDR